MAALHTRTQADVTISGGGTIYLFRPVTPVARNWIDEYVSDDHEMFCGALVVEHRYAETLAAGMQRDGLVVGEEEVL